MELTEVGVRIADGESIDWSSSALTPPDAATVGVLRQLQAVEQIAAFHGSTLPPANRDAMPSLNLDIAPNAADGVTPVRWGRLEIVKKVGRGTFGDVYLAKDRSLDRLVALKLLRYRERDRSPEVIEEGRLLARVRHPNIVAVYGAERIDDRVGVWTEFIDGVTLADELRARGPFPAAEVASIGVDLCEAVQVVHDAGLLHRDVKAQNVMRDSSRRVLLTDFGAGRVVDEGRPSGELVGTPIYLAPEVIAGGLATRGSDVYALGVLLHLLATGTYPVTGRSLRDLRDAHDLGRRRSIAAVEPALPAQLAIAITGATEPDPARRFPSASALAEALRRTLSSTTTVASGRTPGKTAIIAAAIVTAAVVVTWLAPWQSIRDVVIGDQGISNQQFWPAWQATASPSSVSPDGTWALCRIRSRFQLARCPLDGSDPIPVAAILAMPHPLLSPDGRRVAYIRADRDVPEDLQNTREVHVAGIDGSSDRIVMTRSAAEGVLWLDGWSGDGATIAVRFSVGAALGRQASAEQTILVSATTLKPLATAQLPPGAFLPRLSPDGRTLVFTRPRTGLSGSIWTMDVRSGELRNIVPGTTRDLRPFWSSRGETVLFTSDRSGTFGLWRIALKGGVPAEPPELVRDLGRAIAWPYGFTRNGRLFLGLEPIGYDSYIAEVDPASATVIAPPTRIARDPLDANATPDWSPDGRLLAFVSPSGDRGTVTVQRDSGEALLRFPIEHRYFQTRLRWLPDGRSALFGLGRNLLRYDMTTGQLFGSVVLDRNRADQAAVDGATNRVVYRDLGEKPGEIVVKDLASGQEHVAVPASVMAGRRVPGFMLDPDGGRLAFVQRHGDDSYSLEVAEKDAKVVRTLLKAKREIVLGPWTRDGKYLFLSREVDSATDRSEVVILEVATGTARALPIVMPQIWQMRLHPDGRRLAFVTGASGQEMVLMSGAALR